MMRGKRSVTLDLKSAGGVEAAHELIERGRRADRRLPPGVMERLGMGPDVRWRKTRARLRPHDRLGTGRAARARAGHDINYIALAGRARRVRPRTARRRFRRSTWSAISAAAACCCVSASPARWSRAQRSGKGQVVDAAMVDGASLLAAMFSGMLAAKRWSEERGDNVLDTGAPWYDVYETKDGKYVSIGSIETKFYEELLVRLGLAAERCQAARPQRLAVLRKRFTKCSRRRRATNGAAVFEGSDACFAPC
jgi:alpha-methylacyl-CoA racemase